MLLKDGRKYQYKMFNSVSKPSNVCNTFRQISYTPCSLKLRKKQKISYSIPKFGKSQTQKIDCKMDEKKTCRLLL